MIGTMSGMMTMMDPATVLVGQANRYSDTKCADPLKKKVYSDQIYFDLKKNGNGVVNLVFGIRSKFLLVMAALEWGPLLCCAITNFCGQVVI